MYINKWWGSYIGGSDDGLLLLDYFELKNRHGLSLAEICKDLGLDKVIGQGKLHEGGNIGFMDGDNHCDFVFAINVVTDLAALFLESIKSDGICLKEFIEHETELEIEIIYDKQSFKLLMDELKLFIQNPYQYDLYELMDKKSMQDMVNDCRKIFEELSSPYLMLPRWIKYPEIPYRSIGWRMGYGESYWCDEWGPWFDSLSPEQQADYNAKFPEPLMWQDKHEQHTEEIVQKFAREIMTFWRKDGQPKYTWSQASKDHEAGIAQEFCFFWGHQPAKDGTIGKSCLSQWWMQDFRVGASHYCCMEQYMMAEKARIFDDKETGKAIMASNSPKEIKALGRKVRDFNEDLWNFVKHTIVLTGNYYKFSQHRDLLHFLLNTKGILVEASPYDRIWGIGMAKSDNSSSNPTKWKGQNMLGFALTELRDELVRVYENVPREGRV
ncbi:MAG: NADAR domain-containing protein [Deferribacteraceae bacterium]|jgi:ribA/ribD-fused uncharacterized protein|nr:NADAR domain-containing protein [Deferribacteraceae bacterium]